MCRGPTSKIHFYVFRLSFLFFPSRFNRAAILENENRFFARWDAIDLIYWQCGSRQRCSFLHSSLLFPIFLFFLLRFYVYEWTFLYRHPNESIMLVYTLARILFVSFSRTLCFARSNRLENSENKRTKCNSQIFGILVTCHTHSLRSLHNTIT